MRKKVFLAMLIFTFFSIAAVANAGFFASDYISSYVANVYAYADGSISVDYSIVAPKTMNTIGAQTVILQEKPTLAADWYEVETYSYVNYPDMLDYKSTGYSYSLPYEDAISDYYYRAKVYFYSEKGGYDTREYITSTTKAK